jgi:hypothetical protein
MGLTASESSKLIWLSLLSFVVMLGAKFVVPSSNQPFLILGAIGFIGLIYQAVPSGRGSLDFKVGLIVGCNLTLLVYEIFHQITPLLIRGRYL